jgi:predicted GH43/DUF377 family glycosyl hydrolase
MLLRVAERPKRRSSAEVGLPRWHGGELQVDWVAKDSVTWLDPRVVCMRESGNVRLTFVSHLRVATSADGRTLDTLADVRLLPYFEWEEYGVEDPRISFVDADGTTFCEQTRPMTGAGPVDSEPPPQQDERLRRSEVSTRASSGAAVGQPRVYFTYVAVSRHGAATALASTTDFREFERHGIIFPPENKDVLLFPEPIEGRLAALHRPNPATPFSPPEMWLAWSTNLTDWGCHEPLVFEVGDWESGRVGGGVPPIRTKEGWLEIYHGNRKPEGQGEVGEYVGGALLLDLENPAKIRKRSPQPLLSPVNDYERKGFVPNVVFPTGLLDCGETWLIYYGAADTCVGVVEVSQRELLDALHGSGEPCYFGCGQRPH